MTKVIGIDLGTTFSAIASLDDLGNPEVHPSIEDNRRITASAVFVDGKDVIVGDKALNFTLEKPKQVITFAKRQMENDVVFSISQGNWIDKKDGSSEDLTPAQVSSLILKKLKDYTSDVKRAVITVPAMFAEKARKATIEAANLAGIEVIELINEPTAAVLHYASLPGVQIGGRVMIYDLGGGTFDVTIAEVKNKKVDVITSRGDKFLGGKDFDNEIIKILNKKYIEKFSVNAFQEYEINALKKAEEIKKNLSIKDRVSATITGPKGSLNIEISREEFEESIQVFIEKTKMLIEEALEASNMNPSRINQILLVGGSTRIPLVVESIKAIMGKPPLKGVNVDEAVVCGAAIYAGLKTEDKSLSDGQKEKLKQVELTDVCNFYLGTLAITTDPRTRRQIVYNSIIINRDEKLPISVTKSYYTTHENQTELECTVTQSEGPEENREFVNLIHSQILKLPPNRPASQKIDITYSYDVSGIIHCLFFDVDSGSQHEIELNPVSTKQIDESKKIMQEFIIE
jgi:molecular chaperone DnaK